MSFESSASTGSLSLSLSTSQDVGPRANACDPCRSAKQRCDRGRPCSTCVKKKTPEKCKGSSTDGRRKLAKKRNQNENEELRDEVDRLQKLVNVLVAARLESVDSPFASSPSRPSIHPIPHVPETASSNSDEEDLSERLFNLSISSFSTASPSNSVSAQHVQLIDDVEKLLAEIPKTSKPPQIPSSFPFFRHAAPSLETIIARLPSLEDTVMSEKYYWNCTSWFFHPLPEYVYREHKEALYSALRQSKTGDPVSLSILLAVLGIGTYCRCTYTTTGGSPQELHIARTLIELSAAALSHSNFLEEPTVDAIRALSLLAIFHLSIGPGDEGTLGFALTGLAVQSSLQLKLNRDPSQVNANLSFREAEERRSLIHHVYLLDGICTASYSRGYILLHARDIIATFPLDVHDHELETAESGQDRPFEETVLTSLIERFKLSRFSEQVTEELLKSVYIFSSITLQVALTLLVRSESGTPISHERVLELDRELEKLRAAVHPLYQWEHLETLELSNAEKELRAWRISIVWITLWREKLRLHRPFLRRSYTDPTFAYSRQACIDASKGLLAIHACPANLIPAAGFTHKASLACIILALEIVFDRFQSASDEYSSLIESALERLDKFAKISIIARRSVKIIRFLLEKTGHDWRPLLAKRSKSSSSSESDPHSLDLPPLPDSPSLFKAEKETSPSLVPIHSPSLTEPVSATDILAELEFSFPSLASQESDSSIPTLDASLSSSAGSVWDKKEWFPTFFDQEISDDERAVATFSLDASLQYLDSLDFSPSAGTTGSDETGGIFA
ncbi:hypothetical protein JCM16303_000323 [Sporobolomyces ruberrimus]